jgi:alpha-mannosidase
MSDSRTSGALTVYVLPHTHWDREWYLPAGRLRQRLVALIDELLDDPTPTPFLLDGQAIVLEDYLAVRPDRREELSRRLQSGVLEAGPWYVLADELIPSGEALVRNLLAGRRVLRRLGAVAPTVLYSPDAFGHPAALPTLARGIGAPLVVLWRGYGGVRWPAGDTVRWAAPDGNETILFHLPRDGYEFGSALPVDDGAARDRWQRICAELQPRSSTGVLLVQNGADHHARQRELPRAIDALARAAAPAPVETVGLTRFAADLLARVTAQTLPVVHGELRDSYGYAWTLQGTFATRAAQKRRNAGIERLLLRETEPWSALVRLTRGTSLRPVTEEAWEILLQCHPHDTLCGCSIDAVATAAEARFDDAEAQASGIRDDAVIALIGHDPAAAREQRSAWQPMVLVRNAVARPRGGVAEVRLTSFIADEPVGPGSAGLIHRSVAPSVGVGDPALPIQFFRTEITQERIESPRHYPDNDIVAVKHALVWAPEQDGYSVTAYPLRHGPPGRARPPAPVIATREGMDNGLLQVAIGTDGRIDMARVASGWTAMDILRFEDVGERGDLYTHSPFGETIAATFRGTRVRHLGTLRADLETRWRLRVPRDIDARGSRTAALRRTNNVDLIVRLQLDAGAPFLRLLVEGDNTARDHRLRIRVRTGIARADVYADAMFGPVHRVPITVREADTRTETPPKTAPMHRYVSLFDATAGCTIIGDGLAEYEATRTGDVAVTLLRSVGLLSRSDLPERPGHAGWPEDTPAAQCLGPFAATFAIHPHGPRDDATIAAVDAVAENVLIPLTGTTLRSALAQYAPTPGLTLEGHGLAFGCAKESEDGAWIVLRCVNLLDHEVAGSWRLGVPLREARLARLDETQGDTVAVEGGTVRFTASARAVVTLLVR